MSEPYLAEIRIFSFNFPPKGWALCNGQTLPINQNQALFSLLGTTYGGDGRTNFQLPNLQARVPLHRSASFLQGQTAGEASHTLILSEMAAHSHVMAGVATGAGQRSLTRNMLGTPTFALYGSASVGSLDPNAMAVAGGGQPHENEQPYLVLNICIALQGIFPARN